MDAFRNEELLHSIFFFQRFLAMGRDRVMNLSTNAVTIEITLPFISAGRKDGDFPSTSIILIQSGELHGKDCRLQLVQTAVYTLIPMDIFLRGAIIGYGTHCSGKPCIVSGYSAAIP